VLEVSLEGFNAADVEPYRTLDVTNNNSQGERTQPGEASITTNAFITH